MTDINNLDREIREIAELIDCLDSRGKAAIFGVCGRALAPLLAQVEQRMQRMHSLPDVVPTLDLIEAFATGAAEAEEHGDLRARLMAMMPHGDDLDAPWSTYAQDALICVDAGLAAASVDADPKSIWLEYALEPLLASMQIRDVEVIRLRGYNYWGREILGDPMLTSALLFLRHLIEKVMAEKSVDNSTFAILSQRAAILRPVDL